MINAGRDNYIPINSIRVIQNYRLKSGCGSAPITRYVEGAREQERLLDCTHGRRTSSVITLDSGHVVLSFLGADTLRERVRQAKGGGSDGQ